MSDKKLFAMLLLAVVIFSEIRASAPDGYEKSACYCENKANVGGLDEKKERFVALPIKYEQRGGSAWKKSKSPLTLAAAQGNVELVQSLLEEKADVNQKDGHGWTPLMEAASRAGANNASYQAVVRSLLDGRADVNQVDSEGRNALLLALGLEHRSLELDGFNEKVVKLLVEAQADVTKEDNRGRTVLHYAAYLSDSLIDVLAHADVGPDQASNWQAQIVVARDKYKRFVEARAAWNSFPRSAQ